MATNSLTLIKWWDLCAPPWDDRLCDCFYQWTMSKVTFCQFLEPSSKGMVISALLWISQLSDKTSNCPETAVLCASPSRSHGGLRATETPDQRSLPSPTVAVAIVPVQEAGMLVREPSDDQAPAVISVQQLGMHGSKHGPSVPKL